MSLFSFGEIDSRRFLVTRAHPFQIFCRLIYVFITENIFSIWDYWGIEKSLRCRLFIPHIGLDDSSDMVVVHLLG